MGMNLQKHLILNLSNTSCGRKKCYNNIKLKPKLVCLGDVEVIKAFGPQTFVHLMFVNDLDNFKCLLLLN